MDMISRQELTGLFAEFKNVMSENRDFLIELDGKVGDSDLGLTMNKAFSVAADFVAANTNLSIGQTIMQTGMEIGKSAPSTMGTLMATGFMRGGKVLGDVEAIGTLEMRNFWQAFLNGIMERGKAKRGDKTLIDVVAPVADALTAAAADNVPLPKALTQAATAAREGLEATKKMVAQHGKAACFGDKSLGLQDAGATVGVLLIETIKNFVAFDNK